MSKVEKVMFSEFCEPVEIDLRKEISDILLGSCLEIPKAFTILHRALKIDDNEKYVKCQCNKDEHGQHHKSCSLCLGEGYLWEERFVHTFKVESTKDRKNDKAGIVFEKNATFYFEYNVNILKGDSLIELKIDKEGNPVKPFRRGGKWKVKSVDHKRSDRGRSEYLMVTCEFIPVRKNRSRGHESS
jgi:hypothetical protein